MLRIIGGSGIRGFRGWRRLGPGRRGVVLVGLLVFAVPAVAVGVTGGSVWSSGGGGISDTRSTDSIAPSAQSVSKLGDYWGAPYTYASSSGSPCYTYATPTVVGDPPGAPGALYVPDSCGYLEALNPDTGAQLWRVPVSALTGVTGDVSNDSTAVESDPNYTKDANLVFFGDEGNYNQSYEYHFMNNIPYSADLVAVYASGPNQGTAAWSRSLVPPSGSPDWVPGDAWAKLRGSPVVYDGVVYEGVSSQEEAASGLTSTGAPGPSTYPCCSFRGSVAAVSAATGQILWQTYTVPGPNNGVPGDNGGAVWETTPAYDPATNTLFVGTGNNYTTPTSPATSCFSVSTCLDQNHADSILALDATTGQIKWAVATQTMDVYNHSLSACTNPWSNNNGQTCPQPNPNGYGPFNYSPAGYGPNGCGLNPDPTCNTTKSWDYDLGAGPNLFTATVTSAQCGINDQPTLMVGVGSKSGTYTAVDAATGCTLWSTNIGPGGTGGGVDYGTATGGQGIYLQEKDPGGVDYEIKEPDGTLRWITGSSLAALDPATGTILWQTTDPADTNGTAAIIFTAPPTVANGVVYEAEDGGQEEMYAFDASNGNLLWKWQNGFKYLGFVVAGPAVNNGVVYWPGYANMWAFALPGWSQLTALLTAVTGVGPGSSLADKITTIEGYVAANDNTDACGTLGAFVNEVKAQKGKKLTTAQAASFTAQAQAIEATLGC